ncbi:MAG: hypothetical protein LQ338_007401, partial [Usnochroma carphineum]
MASADNEWSPLKSVILGRAENSCFPNEPVHMIEATMPSQHFSHFRPNQPFPADIVGKAVAELDHFAAILKREGVEVHRPKAVDWHQVGGYTGAMPRDGLLTVGNHVIEACFAWQCRRKEVELAFGDILSELEKDSNVVLVRAPKPPQPDTLYNDHINGFTDCRQQWAINNTRPAFDAADFMRFGKVLIGQLSNVTNEKGVQYLQRAVPKGYSVEILEVDDPHAMHIDATILPLRPGLLVYNPGRVTEAALRKHDVLRDWELHPYPFAVQDRDDPPPLFMTSPWLVLNVLSIDEERVVLEQNDTEFADWLRKRGFKPILCPFRHVNSIG